MYILVFIIGLVCGVALEWFFVYQNTSLSNLFVRKREEEIRAELAAISEAKPFVTEEIDVANLNISSEATKRKVFDMLNRKLKDAMVNKRLYLDPTLTCASLAKRFGTNTRYLSVYLNQELHVTFTDYINEFRLQTAVRLLTETDEMTERICVLSGFNYMSRFHRAFVRRFGCPPGEYRKKMKRPIGA